MHAGRCLQEEGVRFAGIQVFLSMFLIGFGPFGLLSAFVAQKLWMWFATPYLHVGMPSHEALYLVFSIFGFFRAGRYVRDGSFDWRDAVTSSLLTPALLLSAGFFIHVMTPHFRL